MSLEVGQLVYIEWVDSMEQQGWRSVENLRETDMGCESVGWIITLDADRVVLAAHKSRISDPRHASICSPMTIPRVAIRHVQTILVQPRT